MHVSACSIPPLHVVWGTGSLVVCGLIESALAVATVCDCNTACWGYLATKVFIGKLPTCSCCYQRGVGGHRVGQ